jgi:malonate-semialdehyde dehydrogenase (acetylating)/methylmalonate-semialdehyde dehydrogenase
MAVACGNTFILKPSERDPSSTLLMAELAPKPGLPDGVLNVVNGDKEAVDTLLTDPRVKAVSFVGSTPIAEYIYTSHCAHGKRVQALGGAKNFAVVMPDADIGNAVSALMGAAYGSCGERCMAIPLVVAVGDDTVMPWRKLIAEIAEDEGRPRPQRQRHGPAGHQAALREGQGLCRCGRGRGRQARGRRPRREGRAHEGGFFLGPCLFDRREARHDASTRKRSSARCWASSA